MLERLILVKIQLQTARQTGIHIDGDTLNRAVSNSSYRSSKPYKATPRASFWRRSISATAPCPRRSEPLKAALEAAAVPHWVDEAILGAMLEATAEESAQLFARLRALSVVEPFPARGQGAVNVHEASRLALREMLRCEQPDRFATLSARARAVFAGRREPALRIEAPYHLFATKPNAAAAEWETLSRDTTNPQEHEAIAASLGELLNAGWLTGAAKAAAILAKGWVRSERGEDAQLETPAREAIALAEEAGRQSILGNAHTLLGDALSTKGKLHEALKSMGAALLKRRVDGSRGLSKVVARHP